MPSSHLYVSRIASFPGKVSSLSSATGSSDHCSTQSYVPRHQALVAFADRGTDTGDAVAVAFIDGRAAPLEVHRARLLPQCRPA